MEKLRIHKMKYRNKGMANKRLRGQQEYHVIFKFDTDEASTDFITKVKEWYYSLEKVGEKVTIALKDNTDEVKKPIKPGPKKGQGGRPAKKNIQR